MDVHLGALGSEGFEQHPITSFFPSKTSLKSYSGSPTESVSPVGSSETATAVEAAGDVVKCMCGAISEESDDGREYVQCEMCHVWQHSECIGFNTTKHSSFACIKCLLDKVSVMSTYKKSSILLLYSYHPQPYTSFTCTLYETILCV